MTVKKKKAKLLFKNGADWSPKLIERIWEVVREEAQELGITYYEPQIEILSAKQMLDAYSSVGMPIYYKHWSFGKTYVSNEQEYLQGDMGLAYEMVINSDPCIAYLMEENSALMQTMVIAHACIGHSAFFKNNYLYKEYTDPKGIIDYLSFAKTYVAACEERYGAAQVEAVLDACHSLDSYGVDLFKKPRRLNPDAELKRSVEKYDAELANYDYVWEKFGKGLSQRNAPPSTPTIKQTGLHGIPAGFHLEQLLSSPHPPSMILDKSQENILYFIEKNSPTAPTWVREIVRIVRKISHYLYPQGLTQVANEGYATFCHHHLMLKLEERGYLEAGSMIEFFKYHAGVINNPSWGMRFNPYKLGFEIYKDMKRVCEAPTDEDKRIFPNYAGGDWKELHRYMVGSFRDETFLQQFLSPPVMRDFRMMSMADRGDHFEVLNISNDRGFYKLRETLASTYQRGYYVPNVQVKGFMGKDPHTGLLLKHEKSDGRNLHGPSVAKVVDHAALLWGSKVGVMVDDAIETKE